MFKKKKEKTKSARSGIPDTENLKLLKHNNISESAPGISKCKSKMIFFHDFEISRFHDKQNIKSHLGILKLKVLRALRLLYKCHPNHLLALR